MTEAESLLADWKAVYAEQHPNRDPDAMPYADSTLALGVLFRRDIAKLKTVGSTANLKGRTLDKIARRDPRDAE